MNKELKEMGKQLKEILEKYPNRQKEILFYIFGEDTIRKLANKLTYEELEAKVNQLETNIEEAIEFIENIWYSKRTTNINDIGYTTNKFLKIKQLLERGKE